MARTAAAPTDASQRRLEREASDAAMPRPVLSEDEKKAAMKGASSDLKFLCADLQLDTEWQEIFFHSGFNTVPLFAGLDRSEQGLRDMLEHEMGLRSADSLAARRTVSLICTVWDEARQLKDKQATSRAEAKTTGIRPPMETSDHAGMRTAYEARWGELPNAEVPSAQMCEAKLEETEQGRRSEGDGAGTKWWF